MGILEFSIFFWNMIMFMFLCMIKFRIMTVFMLMTVYLVVSTCIFFPIPWNKMMIAVDKCFVWKLWYVCYYVYDCDMLHDYGYDSVMFMRMMIGVHWGYSIWLVGNFHNYFSLCLFWSTMGTLSGNPVLNQHISRDASGFWSQLILTNFGLPFQQDPVLLFQFN